MKGRKRKAKRRTTKKRAKRRAAPGKVWVQVPRATISTAGTDSDPVLRAKYGAY
jgi:hypothetical protein